MKDMSKDAYIDLNFTFRTRHEDEFNSFYENVKTCFIKLKENKLEAKDKLCFRHYAILRDIAALKPYADQLKEYQYEHLAQPIHECHKIVEYLEKGQPDDHFKPALFIDHKVTGLGLGWLNSYFNVLNQFVCCDGKSPMQENNSPKPE